MSDPIENSISINYKQSDNMKADPLSEMDETTPLDLKIVLDEFKSSKNEDEILLDHYLRGYFELNKFFPLLGSIFNFVSGDVSKKIVILKNYRQGEKPENYVSVQSMVQYEKESNFSSNSGSRTLLRLHRALAFTAAFLEALKTAEFGDKLGPVVSQIYHNTLAKHHGWLLSKTVGAIFLCFPNKRVIIDRVIADSDKTLEENESLLSQIIDEIKSVYSVTEKYYEDNNILDLP